ncbi:hypothetical protein NP493_178g03057 [Ridgeia piscesae]|uniref:Phosphodiesterase n=1 Tax=Ridgeia piscesae TaxID=27915 RepID=A0AAD9P2Q2_RIDPI|nr:hypothetical protein NP493_178g03057 [Ridgeia piscesae]
MLLRELTEDTHTGRSKGKVLNELAACIAAAIDVDIYNVYLVDEAAKSPLNVFDWFACYCSGPPRHVWNFERKSVLAAHVANTKEAVRLKDVFTFCSWSDCFVFGLFLQDDRFPSGLGVEYSCKVQYVLCLPILQYTGEVLGVVELLRETGKNPFTQEDEELTNSLVVWGALAVYYMQLYVSVAKQKKMNEFLLTVTRSVFQDIVSIDTVIMKIMNYAKTLVDADRTALFLTDTRSRELYARVFDMGDETEASYRTKTILCMPISIRGCVIGVVQMVNKLTGIFTQDDEEAFDMFAVYCGLALHQAKLYEKVRRSEQKYKVALDVLSYHNQATPDEVTQMCSREVPDDMPELILKNYRHVPYHNWSHAFSVAHAMFTVLMTTSHEFTHLESISLFVACLCHDMDHRGKTNSFMVKSATPLAAIYSTSTMEHHHFNQTIAIMQNEGHNVFEYLTSDQYKQVLGDIKHCILATDLALFFGNQSKLKGLFDEGKFCWDEKDHRRLVMANCMTASDLCSMYKPWDIQEKLVYVIMEEFWQQGDEEKLKGISPIPMMDRAKQDQLPQCQVGFLMGICLPCYELLAQLLPESQPMVDGAK